MDETSQLIEFRKEDLDSFRIFSHDQNPLHFDEQYCRRTFYGRPIVHGALATICCIGLSKINQSPSKFICEIKVEFHKAVFLGTKYSFGENVQGDRSKFSLTDENGSKVLSGSIRFSDPNQSNMEILVPRYYTPDPEPDELTARQIEAFETKDFPPYSLENFSNLCAQINTNVPAQLAYGLAVSSYLIGMKCPGKHSIFTALKLKFYPKNRGISNSAKTRTFSHGLVQIQIKHDCFDGMIEAMQRPKAIKRIAISEVKKLPIQGKMLGKKVLVIGGSRGLGEIMVKIMASAGAQVKFSYFAGKNDAHSLLKEMQLQGLKAEAFEFNALSTEPLSKTSPALAEADYIFYFATPRLIFNTASWRQDLYEQYYAYYVEGMIRLLDSASFNKTTKIFLPSTVAITEQTSGLTEYIKAKHAAEAALINLCNAKKIQHIIERLPLLPTDLTNRPNAQFLNSPLSILAEIFTKL